MQEINASIGYDKRLYQQDIAGSRAHASMLEAVGVLTAAENTAIQEGLALVLAEMSTQCKALPGTFLCLHFAATALRYSQHAAMPQLAQRGANRHCTQSIVTACGCEVLSNQWGTGLASNAA